MKWPPRVTKPHSHVTDDPTQTQRQAGHTCTLLQEVTCGGAGRGRSPLGDLALAVAIFVDRLNMDECEVFNLFLQIQE